MIDVKQQVKNLKTVVVLYNKNIVEMIDTTRIINTIILVFLFLIKN